MSENGTRFRVVSSRVVPEQRELILEGMVLEGILVTGMRTELPVGPEGDEMMPAAVQEITMLRPDGDQPANELVFFAADDRQLERWRDVDWTGRELSLGY